MLHIKLTGMKQANILPFYTPSTPEWGQKVKIFFSEKGYDAYYQIKRKEV